MSNTADFTDTGHTSVFYQGVNAGQEKERQRILHLVNSFICYEHHKGCEHAGCYALGNLISYIKEGTK